jgi:hypothetical protein
MFRHRLTPHACLPGFYSGLEPSNARMAGANARMGEAYQRASAPHARAVGSYRRASAPYACLTAPNARMKRPNQNKYRSNARDPRPRRVKITSDLDYSRIHACANMEQSTIALSVVRNGGDSGGVTLRSSLTTRSVVPPSAVDCLLTLPGVRSAGGDLRCSIGGEAARSAIPTRCARGRSLMQHARRPAHRQPYSGRDFAHHMRSTIKWGGGGASVLI